MKIHPAAELFPMLPDAELTALAEDIRKHGQQEPIVIFEGQILDGRNRWRACELAGTEPKKTYLQSCDDPIQFAISRNLHRRHLDESQRGMVGAAAMKLYAVAAREKQQQSAHSTNAGLGRSETVLVNLPKPSAPVHAHVEAARSVNVSPTTVQQAKRVIDEGTPELNRAVVSGALPVSVAAEVARLPKEEQRAIISQPLPVIREKAREIKQERVEALKYREPIAQEHRIKADIIGVTIGLDGKPIPPVSPFLEIQPRKARTFEYVILDDWHRLSPEDQKTALLSTDTGRALNKQDNDSIEWAKWSWNPVTGCKHDCPYCYARDIAQRFYPQGFTPTLHPDRLFAPKNTKVPDLAATDISLKNIFTCSMADLFGRWVPSAWIESVLSVVRANPQWNFLFLTKFPKRYTEFSFPDNAWLGTSVDCQVRVKAAEEALSAVSAKVKWLSIEPMLEPLSLRLDLFQWIVIGGASASTQTPEWRVPTSWWAPLHTEAARLGVAVYHKTNLYQRDKQYPGAIAPTPSFAPPSFEYLKKRTREDVVLGERGFNV